MGAIFFVCSQGHLPMVVTLIQHGADAEALDGEGLTPFHLASQYGHTGIVLYLLARLQVDKSRYTVVDYKYTSYCMNQLLENV